MEQEEKRRNYDKLELKRETAESRKGPGKMV